MRREKSLRNGVHHADAVVRGPVYRTHLHASPHSVHDSAHAVNAGLYPIASGAASAN
jgi:hypothetical protein